MNSINDSVVLDSTKQWISDFVIGHSICPFAKSAFVSDNIYYTISDQKSPREVMQHMYELTEYLGEHDDISNAMLILPEMHVFDELLDCKSVIDLFFEESKLEELYQTVAFHPDFVFMDSNTSDAGNFVNRSPYPMLHLLRVDEVEKAIESYDGIDSLSYVNESKLMTIGNEQLSKKLKSYQN